MSDKLEIKHSKMSDTYNFVNHSKIAKVTVLFWTLKIIATTLGETTGDFIAQTLNLGYIFGLTITSTLLACILFFQVRANKFYPVLFWATIVATTTAGTEVSDLMDRTLGLGYTFGAALLAIGLLATLAIWYIRDGNLNVDPIVHRPTEIMFWTAVVFSNSLGTAFGDYLVDVAGLGYLYSAAICALVIIFVLIFHKIKAVNNIALFWIAFIFTRPFGATFGDFLTKPSEKGGLDLGTYNASFVCLILMAGIIFFAMRRGLK